MAANLDPQYIIVKQMNSSYHSERLKMVLIKWRRVGLLRTLRINAKASVTDRRSHGMQTIISVRMTNTTSDITAVEGNRNKGEVESEMNRFAAAWNSRWGYELKWIIFYVNVKVIYILRIKQYFRLLLMFCCRYLTMDLKGFSKIWNLQVTVNKETIVLNRENIFHLNFW